MTRLLELLQVLGVNHVAKLVLDADDQLDHIKGVKTMAAEFGIETNSCLSSRSEVVLGNRDDILLNLVVRLENESVLGRVNLGLPKVDLAGLLGLVAASNEGVVVQTEVLQVAHLLGGGHKSSAGHHHSAALSEGSESNAAQHFFFT